MRTLIDHTRPKSDLWDLTTSQRDRIRQDFREDSNRLATMIEDRCTGSEEVVYLGVDGPELLGSIESNPSLRGQRGYIVIPVAGRHLGQIAGTVQQLVFGDWFEALNRADVESAAITGVRARLVQMANNAGANPDDGMADATTGQRYTLDQVAHELFAQAWEKNRHRSNAITGRPAVSDLITAAISSIRPDAFQAERST